MSENLQTKCLLPVNNGKFPDNKWIFPDNKWIFSVVSGNSHIISVFSSWKV